MVNFRFVAQTTSVVVCNVYVGIINYIMIKLKIDLFILLNL